jgi:hypothetical protein
LPSRTARLAVPPGPDPIHPARRLHICDQPRMNTDGHESRPQARTIRMSPGGTGHRPVAAGDPPGANWMEPRTEPPGPRQPPSLDGPGVDCSEFLEREDRLSPSLEGAPGLACAKRGADPTDSKQVFSGKPIDAARPDRCSTRLRSWSPRRCPFREKSECQTARANRWGDQPRWSFPQPAP